MHTIFLSLIFIVAKVKKIWGCYLELNRVLLRYIHTNGVAVIFCIYTNGVAVDVLKINIKMNNCRSFFLWRCFNAKCSIVSPLILLQTSIIWKKWVLILICQFTEEYKLNTHNAYSMNTMFFFLAFGWISSYFCRHYARICDTIKPTIYCHYMLCSVWFLHLRICAHTWIIKKHELDLCMIRFQKMLAWSAGGKNYLLNWTELTHCVTWVWKLVNEDEFTLRDASCVFSMTQYLNLSNNVSALTDRANR